MNEIDTQLRFNIIDDDFNIHTLKLKMYHIAFMMCIVKEIRGLV